MTRVCLGDVANERKENCKTDEYNDHIVGLEHLIPQEVTLTQWAENIENTFTKVFHKGDVLFGRRRAYLKKAAVAPFDGICSGDITVIEAKPNKIVPELLPFIIQNDNLFDYAVEKSAGSLSPRVKWSHLQNYEFELPDLNKQRELAELLWAAEETKQAYKKMIKISDNLILSVYTDMFGDILNNRKNIKTNKLKDILYIERGGSPRPIADYITNDENAPNWIKIGDASTDSKYIYKTQEKIKLSGTNKSRYVKEGDFLLSNSMSFGRPYILKTDGYIHDGWLVLRDNNNIFNKIYLYYTLISNEIKTEFEKSAAGSVVSNLNKDIVGNIKILVPNRVAQDKFANIAEVHEKSLLKLQETLFNINEYIKSIITQNLTKEVSHV